MQGTPPNTHNIHIEGEKYLDNTSFLTKVSTTKNFLNSPDMVNAIQSIEGKDPVHIIHLTGAKVIVIRSAEEFHKLINKPELIRGISHGLVRHLFGQKTIFLLPHGDPKHKEKKAELRSHLNMSAITKQVNEIATIASDVMLPNMEGKVNLEKVVSDYLFKVVSFVMTGEKVESIEKYSNDFSIATNLSLQTGSSTKKTLLYAALSYIGSLFVGEAKKAMTDILVIGKELIIAGSKNPDSLVADMLRRHSIDPSSVNENTEFSDELLHDITMTFAAANFTTINLVLNMFDYLYSNPDKLQELRNLIEKDFPNGIKGDLAISNNSTTQMLFPLMMQNSPVEIVARDISSTTEFESRGKVYTLNPRDIVLFDLHTIQKSNVEILKDKLHASSKTSLLEILNSNNDKELQAFFGGKGLCPGRFLTTSDSILFILNIISKYDISFDAKVTREGGIVTRVTGGVDNVSVCPYKKINVNSMNNDTLLFHSPSALAIMGDKPSGSEIAQSFLKRNQIPEKASEYEK